MLGFYLRVVDPSRKVPDLNCEVQDLLLEVLDLEWRCRISDPVGTPQGVVGRGRGDSVPPLFSTGGGRVPHSPLFWTEIRAKVSPLLQLVTY